jgi:PAS domain S-box-containing protein
MKKELKYSLIIALTYFVFSTLWIFCSDFALAAVVKDTEQFRKFESLKGLVFVFISAGLIFSLVLLYYRRYKSFQDKYFEIHQEEDRVFRELPIGIAIIDLKGQFIKVNRSLTSLLGYSSSELLQMHRREICYIDEQEPDHDFLNDLLHDPEKVIHIHRRLRKKDGQAIWCHLSCILMQSLTLEAKYFVINIQNVDRELKMQKRVVKLNSELLDAQRLGRFGHWSYNFTKHEARLSEQAAAILRMDTESPAPEDILALFQEEVRLDISQRVEKLSTEGGRLHSLTNISTAVNQLKYIEIEAVLTLDADAGGMVLKGTIKDVTHIIRLQLEREKFHKYLMNWAFKLSHELRQPISSIMGLSEIMRQDLVKEGEQAQLTNYLAQAASELDNQTRDLAAQFQRMQDLLDLSSKDLGVMEKVYEVARQVEEMK